MLLFTQVIDVTDVINITDIIINGKNEIIINDMNDITDKTGVPDVAGQREISC